MIKELNNKLRKIYKGKNISQLSKSINISQPKLSIWKCGLDFKELSTIERLCKEQGLSLYLDGNKGQIYTRLVEIINHETRFNSILELSKVTGISRPTWYNLRLGNNTSLSTIDKIIDKLHIQIKLEIL